MTRRSTNPRTGAVVLVSLSIAALVTFLSPPGANADGCAAPGQLVGVGGGWTRIAAPTFPTGASDITAYAADPVVASRLYVTNGSTVMVSPDDGCTWTARFSIPELPMPPYPFTSRTSSIIDIVVPDTMGVRDRVYLTVNEVVDGNVSRPHVLRSDDAGATWELSTLGLLSGRPVELAVAPSDPAIVYLGVNLPIPESSEVPSGFSIYSSSDAGQTWTLRSTGVSELAADIDVDSWIQDVAVDPGDARSVWLTNSQYVCHSQDGGTAWSCTNFVIGLTGALDISEGTETGSDVIAFSLEEAVGVQSGDGGESWDSLRTPTPFKSAARGGSAEDIVGIGVLDDGRSVVYHRAGSAWVPVRASQEPLANVTSVRRPKVTFYAFSADSLWRYRPVGAPKAEPGFTPPGAEPNPPSTCPLPAQTDPPVQMEPTTLDPASRTIALMPGQRETVRYQLDLGAVPSRVDIYFLIDASDSMDPSLCGAAQGALGIANSLLARGIHAWFGAGTYQHNGLPANQIFLGGCNWWETHTYRRDHPVAPLTRSLGETLRRIRACGGEEPQMSALLQAATGAGQASPVIMPGQNANFRGNATPVIVHIADEELHESQAKMDQAVAAMNQRGIRQVGVAVPVGKSFSPTMAAGWLREFAARTDAVASSPGADCDGDGDIDIAAGEPLVCVVETWSEDEFGPPLARAIVGSIMALPDVADVSLIAEPTDTVVERIEPATYPAIDLRKEHPLSFDVTYSCEAVDTGASFPVELTAEVRSEAVAVAGATVLCLAPPIDPIDPLAFAPGPVIPIGPLPPAPPPPQLPPAGASAAAPAPAPASQGQGQTQAQSQAQPQPGLAAQKHEQPQTALARATEVIKDQEYAMSARRDAGRSQMPLGLGAGAITLAYGCVIRSRIRTRRAEIRRRS